MHLIGTFFCFKSVKSLHPAKSIYRPDIASHNNYWPAKIQNKSIGKPKSHLQLTTFDTFNINVLIHKHTQLTHMPQHAPKSPILPQ